MLTRLNANIALGLAIGGVFSAWVLALALFERSTTLHTHGAGINVFVLIGLYLAGGVWGGFAITLFHRLVHWVIGAAVVGIVAALPVVAAMTASMSGVPADTYWLAVAIVSVALGAPVGVIYRSIFAAPARREHRQRGDAPPRHRRR